MSAIQAMLAQARSLMVVGRHEEALPLLQRAVTEEPEAWEPRCLLAACLISLTRYQEAAAMAGSAIPLNPEAEWPHRLRSIAFGYLRDRQASLAEAQQAVQFGPSIAETWFTLAEAQLHIRKPKDAIASANRGLELAPADVHGHDLLGRAALRQLRWKDAETHFRRALQIDPTRWVLMNNLGLALDGQRRRSEAIAAFEAAARLNPRAERARANLFEQTQLYMTTAIAALVVLVLVNLVIRILGRVDPRQDVVEGAILLLLVGVLVWVRRRRRARLSAVARSFYQLEVRKARLRNAIQIVCVVIPTLLALWLGFLLHSVLLIFGVLLFGWEIWGLVFLVLWKSRVLPWLAERGF